MAAGKKEGLVLFVVFIVGIVAQILNFAFLEHLPYLPVKERSELVIEWIESSFQPLFDVIAFIIKSTISPITGFLTWIHPVLFISIFVIIGFKLGGWKLSLSNLIIFVLIGMVGYWDETMLTLSLVITASFFSLIVGIPLGVLKAHVRYFEFILNPVLSFMQTMPLFVYLIPAVIIFKIGNVPGIIATFIFATPPAVRLTSLGIKQIPDELIDAGKAFGASTIQFLFKVELPLAMPSMIVGRNQTIMLSLSMVVVASMIGAEGLGQEILEGVQSLDLGQGVASGFVIVLIATVLDHVTKHAWE